jgi:hypothetical protein
VSPGPDERVRREDPDALLDPMSDPGGAAFGAMGAEAGSDLNWFKMLHVRVQMRATQSPKYQLVGSVEPAGGTSRAQLHVHGLQR